MGKLSYILLIVIFVPLFNVHAQKTAGEKNQFIIEKYDAKAWSFRKTLPDSTIYYTDLIIDQLRASNDTLNIAKYFNYKGIGYYYKGDNYTSFNYYTLAYQTAKALGDSIQYAHSMNNLGRFFSSQGNYVKAFDYSKQALLVFEQVKQRWNCLQSEKTK